MEGRLSVAPQGREGALDVEVVHPDPHAVRANSLAVAIGPVVPDVLAILGDIGRRGRLHAAGAQETVQLLGGEGRVAEPLPRRIEDEPQTALRCARPELGGQVPGAVVQLVPVGAGDDEHVRRRLHRLAGLQDADAQARVGHVVEKRALGVGQQHPQGPSGRRRSPHRRRLARIGRPGEAAPAVGRPFARAQHQSLRPFGLHHLSIRGRSRPLAPDRRSARNRP